MRSHLVDVAGVQPDGVASLGAGVPEAQEVVGDLRGASNLCGSSQAQHQQIQYQPIVLHDKGSKLQTPDQTIGVGVRHVLVGDHNVVLGCDVVCNVVVQDQPQKPAKKHRDDENPCRMHCRGNKGLLVKLLSVQCRSHIRTMAVQGKTMLLGFKITFYPSHLVPALKCHCTTT